MQPSSFMQLVWSLALRMSRLHDAWSSATSTANSSRQQFTQVLLGANMFPQTRPSNNSSCPACDAVVVDIACASTAIHGLAHAGVYRGL